jgi:hypothetical protein
MIRNGYDPPKLQFGAPALNWEHAAQDLLGVFCPFRFDRGCSAAVLVGVGGDRPNRYGVLVDRVSQRLVLSLSRRLAHEVPPNG